MKIFFFFGLFHFNVHLSNTFKVIFVTTASTNSSYPLFFNLTVFYFFKSFRLIKPDGNMKIQEEGKVKTLKVFSFSLLKDWTRRRLIRNRWNCFFLPQFLMCVWIDSNPRDFISLSTQPWIIASRTSLKHFFISREHLQITST